MVGVVAGEVPRRLSHRVGRALEPVRAVGRLLGGEHLDEAVREHVQAVGLRDVAVERRGVELRQHEDPLEAGVQAVADRDVDEPVLAAERHRRLRAHVGERKEPRAASAAQDQGQHVIHAPSSYLARGTPCRRRNVTGAWECRDTGRRPVVGPEGMPDRERIVSRCRCRKPSPPTGRLPVLPCHPAVIALRAGISQLPRIAAPADGRSASSRAPSTRQRRRRLVGMDLGRVAPLAALRHRRRHNAIQTCCAPSTVRRGCASP